MNVTLKVGADPEMFVHGGQAGFISPHTFFPGSKAEPYAVTAGALQVDGLAAELNILPATTREEFVENYKTVYEVARTFLAPTMSFARIPSVRFRPEYYASLEEKLKEVGCDPDYNAWENAKKNPIPVLEPGVRVAGGHIHLGFGENFNSKDLFYQAMCCDLVKQLDCLIGAWDTAYEACRIRKQSYGKAGAFRFKPYGLEYRTPSNRWTQIEYSMGVVFDYAKKAFDDYMKDIRHFEKYPEIREVINNSDREKARKIHNAILNG